MAEGEQRGTERLRLEIPIRVIAFGASGTSFTEDTFTVEVNRAGARIALKHRLAAGDTLRIINLGNLAEADFRVVGPTRLDRAEIAEWGVESVESERNIWGIEFSAPIATGSAKAGALLQCQDCRKEALCVLSLMEVDVLDASGVLERPCDRCGQLSLWAYADVARRPQETPPAPPGVSAPQAEKWDRKVERRAHKRLALKLPVRVRNLRGDQEIGKTENISKGGLAVILEMKLAVGELVQVVCPYTQGDQNLEQKAEVRRRVELFAGSRWLYGLRYLH
jgi:hypothetical protein